MIRALCWSGTRVMRRDSELHSLLSPYGRFLALPRDQLLSATLIDNPKFLKSFLRAYPQHSEKLIHLPTNKTISLLHEPPRPALPPAILDHLRIALTPDPQLYFLSSLRPEKLLEWLARVSGNRALELPLRSFNRQNPPDNVLWFSSLSFHRFEEWLACEIEKSILSYYFSPKDRAIGLRQLTEFMKSKGLEIRALSLKLEEIDEDSLEMEEREKISAADAEMKAHLQHEVISLAEQQVKKKKRRRRNKKRNEAEQQSGSVAVSVETDTVEITESTKRNDSNSVETPTENHFPLDCELHQKNQQSHKEDESDQKSTTVLDIGSDSEADDLSSTPDFSLISPAESQPQPRKKRRRHKAQHSKLNDLKQKVISNILNNQLTAMLDNLSTESNRQYESKVVAFQRVRWVSTTVLGGVQALLHGSNALGISLPSSDVDIMLVDSGCRSRDEVISCLRQLEAYFRSFEGEWISSCKACFTARVPLLQLQVDPTVGFTLPPWGYQWLSIDPSYTLSLKDPSKGCKVRLDLTIPLFSGPTSTELMRAHLASNPAMQQTLLILKHILRRKGYSDSYTGGIGSFCLFLMVAAFCKLTPAKEDNPAEVLINFLRFYGQQFDNSSQTIFLRDQGNCFLPNDEAARLLGGGDADCRISKFLRIVNPNVKQLIGSSYSQFELIREQWRRILTQLGRIADLISCEIDNQLDPSSAIRLLENKRQLQRWTSRLQNKLQLSVQSVIG